MTPHSDIDGAFSMTAFATRRGQGEGAMAHLAWTWELRSVNGKGLDLRLRLPDGIEGLEPAVRAALGQGMTRGNVTLGLKLQKAGLGEVPRINATVLDAALAAIAEVQRRALTTGVVIAPPTAAEVLGLRGVVEMNAPEEIDAARLLGVLLADLPPLLAAFHDMRRTEGQALTEVMQAQLDQIEALIHEARAAAEARRPRMAEALTEALARVTSHLEADPVRLAQELALLAVKADITEETDRLTAHVAAARALLAQGGPIGRKLDFLAQEFNREANTLCSKAGDITLTRIGLDLKHLIDQLREQVQNLE